MADRPLAVAGVDAGSEQIRCVLLGIEESGVRFLGAGSARSRGWSKSRVSDQTAISECTRSAIEGAERVADIQVGKVVVGFGGSTIQGGNSHGVYEFGRPREVGSSDLGYAMELASHIRLEDDRMLLGLFPRDFTLDGRAGYRNPSGAVCSRLEANAYVVTASTQEHQNVVAAMHQAHVAVEETVFEPVAAAYAAVLPEDRARGVAVIDIGAHSTDLVVYDGEALSLASSIPVGGEHFTRDVAWCLSVSFEDAQRLKEEYGCAILGLTGDSSLIEVPSVEGRPPRETSRRQLNEILEARAEELFLYVRDELGRAGMEQGLLEGVVLTGGGALLNGMFDMAERILNCQARNGLPRGIEGWPEEIHDPAWTTAAGLAMYSARLYERRNGNGKRRLLGW